MAKRRQNTAAGVVPSLGESDRQRLARLGVSGDFDLLLHLPLRYVDETRVYPIADVLPGQTALIEGEIEAAEVVVRRRRMLRLSVADASGSAAVTFFHFWPNQVRALQPGKRIRLFGEMKVTPFGREMAHPEYHMVDEPRPVAEALTPIYPTAAGLAQAKLRQWIGRCLEGVPLAEVLPPSLLGHLDLPALMDSLRFVHSPPPEVELASLEERRHPAFRRLAFDELLAQQLSMRRHYRRRRSRQAPALPNRGELTARLLASLPFELTSAQKRVVDEISRDLALGHPMQRLLQGDVGSGKTVVAALAAAQTIENGHQAAIMAPTEILAEQHYLKLAAWLEPLGVKVAWFSGAQGKRERDAALAKVAGGEAGLAIGTHALFQDEVSFARLGLSIVDEQHRFGVHQRLALRQKGDLDVHQLMMSATPIPRTLSMSYCADLDVSVIDALPPGRSPVKTKLVDTSRREEVVAAVERAVAGGRQAYWVCPLVEESEVLDLKAAEDTWRELAETFAGIEVGLVHGRMKAREKQAVMQRFKAGDTGVLVATTVIEVGVDVPNASVMVIEHAERMGLAQLHQLRGRVGRGAVSSVCLLLYQQPLTEVAKARLKAVFETGDGFEIARRDLEIRGPGEFLGIRQSGVPLLRVADLERDADLVDTCRQAAEELLARHPEAAAAHLARWAAHRQEFLDA